MAFKPAAAAALPKPAGLPSHEGQAAQQTNAMPMRLDQVRCAWHVASAHKAEAALM